MKPAISRAMRSRERGFILVGILVIVMLGSMVAMSLLFRIQSEESAAAASAGSEQAWLAALSGIEDAMRVVATAKPGALEWRDNPARFKDRFVYDDGSDKWSYTIYSAGDLDALEPVRYGLTDEASKLNLNTAKREMLARVPGFDTALLDAYLGPEASDSAVVAIADIPSIFATETSARRQPGSLSAFTELFLFPGFTPTVLYGEDANFNLQLDPNEDDGDGRQPSDNQDGKLELGLRRYLTLTSYDLETTDKAGEKTNINDADDPLPEVELPASVTNFIIALRTNSMQIAHPSSLLGAKIKVKNSQGQEVEVVSGLEKEQLDDVLKLFTCSEERKSRGLVNVNTAPAAVLAALPGMDDGLAERIVSTRLAVSPERRETIAWIFTEGALDEEQFKLVAPHLTARSLQFRFNIVAYALPSGRYKAFDVEVDVADGHRRITRLRDLTRYGLPFQLEQPASGDGSGEPAGASVAILN